MKSLKIWMNIEWNTEKYILFVRTNIQSQANKWKNRFPFICLRYFCIFVYFSQSNFYSVFCFTSTRIMAIHQIENKVNCSNLLHENVRKYLKMNEFSLFAFRWRLHAIFACVSKCLYLTSMGFCTATSMGCNGRKHLLRRNHVCHVYFSLSLLHPNDWC